MDNYQIIDTHSTSTITILSSYVEQKRINLEGKIGEKICYPNYVMLYNDILQ